jgi:metallophosphoesterase (TIGR00282 family)
MKILFIGDIVGKPGRRVVENLLPGLRQEHGVDFVIANAENSAGGLGTTPEVLRDLKGLGIDGFTMGNHTWRKKAIIPVMDQFPELVRPANFPDDLPGRGMTVLRTATGGALGLVNLLGRVYMEPFECPFRHADRAIAALREETRVILVDMHAEATSEKAALGWHLDGRCTAVVGTHTHVQTADAWIMPGGTAFITDVGMCGPLHSVIGTEVSPVLDKFRRGMPHKFEVAGGPAVFSAVLIEADEASGRARRIATIFTREAA